MGISKVGIQTAAAALKARTEGGLPLSALMQAPEFQKMLAAMGKRDPREVNALVAKIARENPAQLEQLLKGAAAKNPKVQGAIAAYQMPTDSLSLSQVFGKLTEPRPVAQADAARALADVVIPKATSRNAVDFHFSTQDSRRALLDSIKNAKQSFYVETFIWHNDQAGKEVIAALAAKKQANPAFDIKVLVDGFGLRQGSGGHNDSAIVDQLKAIGADVLEYRPTWHSPELNKAVPFAYTHRKLYIADGEQFISGGRNIGNEYLKPKYQVADKGVQEHSWHDMLFTVKGDETGRVLDEFMTNWERAGGKRPVTMPTVVPHAGGTARVQSFTTDPIAGTEQLWDAQSRAIQNAKSDIVARYPYFSDDELVAELIRAKKAKPELKIKVLLPANKEASHEGDIYQALNKETAGQLSQAGIEVRMFEGGKVNGKPVQRFSHMKAMSVDGELLSIGSANADARTFNGNHELNTFISDREATRKFNAMTMRDWRASKPVTAADLAPASADEAQKRGLLEALDFLL